MTLNPSRMVYYETMARVMGVPPLWIEDAAQDIAFTVWRRGNDGYGTVRSAAIDAARRYGPRTKRGVERQQARLVDELHARVDHPADAVDEIIDAQRALTRMPRRLLRMLAKSLRGEHLTNSEQTAVAEARRRMRELVA